MRAAGGLALVLSLGYATLPLWLPTEQIRLRLEQQLTGELGTTVRVARFSAGWLQGVVLEELTVADNAAPGGGHFARIGQIRCEFAPLKLLTGDRVRALELTDPQIWLHIDEAGRLRLPRFNEPSGAGLPSYNYTVLGLQCHVFTPGVNQTFRIDRLDLQLDPPSGLLHLSSATRVERLDHDDDEPTVGRLDFDANIRIPRLKITEPLQGSCEIEWSDLALNDLPVPMISHVPVEQVDGISSGRLTLETHPSLGIAYHMTISFDGVQIMRPELNQPAQVPDADLSCGGHWEPNLGVFVMNELACETPSIRLQAGRPGRPALRLEENGQIPIEACIAGQVKDWQGLRKEIPELDHLIRTAGIDLGGMADFSVEAAQGLREHRVALSIEARDSDLIVRAEDGTALLRAQAGVTKQLQAETLRERNSGRIRQPVFKLELGELAMELQAEARVLAPVTVPDEALEEVDAELSDTPVTDSWFTRLVTVLPTVQADMRVRCADAAGLRALLPGLAEQRDLTELSGPFELAAVIDPRGDWSRVLLSATIATDSTLHYGDLLRKNRGRPLHVRTEARLPYSPSGQVDVLSIDLRHGRGLMELASRRGGLAYKIDWPDKFDSPLPHFAQGTWDADLKLESVEELIALMPALSELLRQSDVGFLAGKLDVDLRTEFAYEPDDSIVRTQAHAIADGLALRYSDVLTKRAGERLSIDASHRYRRGSGHDEHCWELAVVQPAGRIGGSVWIAGDGADPADTAFECVSVRADIDELADLLAPLARACDRLGWRASGKLSAEGQHIRIGSRQMGSLRVDATRADLSERRVTGIHKVAGVPATLEASWSGDAESAAGAAWTLTEGAVQLAGVKVDQLRGSATLASDAQPGASLVPDGLAGRLEAVGVVACDEALASLHPRLREVLEEHAVTGHAEWQFAVGLEPDGLAVQGDIDASHLGLKIKLLEEPGIVLQRAAGEHLSASFDVTLPATNDEAPKLVTLHDAVLRFGGNAIFVKGVLPSPGDREPDTLEGLDLQVRADLPQLNDLTGYLPSTPLERLEGEAQLELALAGKGDTLRLTSGHGRMSEVEVGSAARPLCLHGSAVLMPDQTINLEELDWRWGLSSGTFSGTFAAGDNRYDMFVGIGGRQIHVEDLLSCVDELRTHWSGDTIDQETQTQDPGDDAVVREVIDLLRRMRLTLHGHVDTVHTPLPLGIKATADAGWKQLRLQDGAIELTFGCLVDGGLVDGRVTADLNAADPTYRLTYTADRIQPGSVVDAYLRRTFPGMVASGPLTLIDESVQKLLPAPGEPNFEVGKGELIIDGGVVSGRAAPAWMVRIFPGLNLATFEFSRMHSWFDKANTGRVQHQMLYHGTYYNVYMIGWSNPEGFFDYEVGIDLLAGLESEYWANSGQGRVPLFNKTGQVREDGSLADETVTFVSFRRVLETLFVRNNPVITAYHAVRKRVLEQQ